MFKPDIHWDSALLVNERTITRFGFMMMRMDSVRKGLRLAVSCLMVLALVVVASCAPFCTGTVCLPNGSSVQAEAICHGMAGHGDAPTLVHAKAARCAAGDTDVAIVGKSNLGVSPVSRATGTFSDEEIAQSFSAGTSLAAFPESFHRSSSSHAIALVLRV